MDVELIEKKDEPTAVDQSLPGPEEFDLILTQCIKIGSIEIKDGTSVARLKCHYGIPPLVVCGWLGRAVFAKPVINETDGQ